MATDTSSAFKSAADPTPPSHGTSAGDSPPVTPSEQVASQEHGLGKGPPPPTPELGGQAVINQTHRDAMQKDQGKSDQANHYTRSQSPASSEQIKALGQLFAKQAQQKEQEKAKTIQQAKNNQQDKDRGHER